MDYSSAYTIGISIVIAGYFIGNGIKNELTCFGKGEIHKDEKSMWGLIDMQIDDMQRRKFVKKKYLRKWLGFSKKELDAFILEYPDMPNININGEIYYIREELNEWFKSLTK